VKKVQTILKRRVSFEIKEKDQREREVGGEREREVG
jgi:hypothetical protein